MRSSSEGLGSYRTLMFGRRNFAHRPLSSPTSWHMHYCWPNIRFSTVLCLVNVGSMNCCFVGPTLSPCFKPMQNSQRRQYAHGAFPMQPNMLGGGRLKVVYLHMPYILGQFCNKMRMYQYRPNTWQCKHPHNYRHIGPDIFQ